MIHLDTIRSWDICYDSDDPGWLDRTAAGRTEFTLAEVLAAARNGTDRIWVLTRPGVLTRPQLLEWLARLVERALARVPRPDQRCLAVVAALRADAITPDIRSAANAAYYAAAYYADADAAADSAAAAAERRQQVADAMELTGE